MQRWYPDYQTRDRDIVDYAEFRIDGCDVPFRGPGFDPFMAERDSYFTCFGAAQTYGCYYEHPYPALLSQAIGLPALNLAVGGAGPGFYGQYDALIEAANRGRFVILQCMAARHESNSRFEADGYVEFLKDRRTGESMTSAAAWQRIVAEEVDQVERYVEETRRNWVETSRKLIERISVPVIFFWFARRKPDYEIDRAAIARQAKSRREGKDEGHFVDGLMGDFPHLIDGPTARAVAEMCDDRAECLSARGMGQPLINRFTGAPVGDLSFEALGKEFTQLHQTHNVYYPSAEMHEDACAVLLPTVGKLLATG